VITTEYDSWLISDLLAKVATRDVELPRFQRGVVWIARKRRELIGSLLEGLPIGSLLMYEDKRSGKFLLVDGLQRTNSIREYGAKPLASLEVRKVDASALQGLYKALVAAGVPLASQLDCDSSVEKWMRELGTTGKGFSAYDLVTHMGLEHQSPDFPKAYAPAEDVVVQLSELSQALLKQKIGVILYRGPVDRLPDIYDRVNSKGTKLNRYETVAAAWPKADVDLTAPFVAKVAKALIRRYEALRALEFEIDGYTPGQPLTDGSLFEYMIGLGAMLKKDYGLLYGRPSGDMATESIGFTLAAAILGLKVGRIVDLPGKFPLKKGAIDVSRVQTGLTEGSEHVRDLLQPRIGLPVKRSLPHRCHTEFQIASIVARYAVGKHDFDSDAERPGWKKDWAVLDAAVHRHYLADAVRGVWGGHGDTTMFDRVWSAPGVPSDYYAARLTDSEMNTVLSAWFNSELRASGLDRQPFSGTQKAFLRYASSGKSKPLPFWVACGVLNIDHIMPLERLRDLGADNTWPGSHVANLLVLDERINKSKNRSTFPDYLARVSKETSHVQSLLFVPLDDTDASKFPDRDAYVAYLKKNYALMCQEVLDTI
jgi:hypothetical protein